MGTDARHARARGRGAGFTLIELIVSLVILVVVLGMAYQILENCLRTEQWVERAGRPEKIGEAIISLIRKDLEGVVFYNVGTDRVFQVIDGGSGENARDELQCYTTMEPTPLTDEENRGFSGDSGNIHTITAVTYYLKENSQGIYSLFRRENVGSDGDPFETGGGISNEIYDKVARLSILCFDATADYVMGTDAWTESWDARQRNQLAVQDEMDRQATSEGIPTVGTQGAGAVSTPQASADAVTEENEAALPPAIIPSAVRIEIAIYAGDERGIYKNPDGTPMAPRVFSTIVPILAAQRLALSAEITDSLGGEAGAEGSGEEGGAEPRTVTSGPLTPGGKTGGKGGAAMGAGGGRRTGGAPPGSGGGGRTPGPGAGGGRGGRAPVAPSPKGR